MSKYLAYRAKKQTKLLAYKIRALHWLLLRHLEAINLYRKLFQLLVPNGFFVSEFALFFFGRGLIYIKRKLKQPQNTYLCILTPLAEHEHPLIDLKIKSTNRGTKVFFSKKQLILLLLLDNFGSLLKTSTEEEKSVRLHCSEQFYAHTEHFLVADCRRRLTSG